MADEPQASDKNFGFLTHKVGPLPVWMWAAIAVAGYYWYTHYGPGASKAATGTGGKKSTVIVDENRGQFAGTSGIGGSQFKTNNEWEAAAINFLVGESVPPDEGSAAVWKYLHSEALNPQEEKDVNLAIEGIGPPPVIPAPSTTSEKPKPHVFPIHEVGGTPPKPGPNPPPPHPGPHPVPVHRRRRPRPVVHPIGTV